MLRLGFLPSLLALLQIACAAAVVNAQLESEPRQLTATLEWEPKARFTISGLRPQDVSEPSQLFKVSVATSTLDEPPNLMGHYERGDNSCSFFPKFPLQAGLAYRIHLLPAEFQDTIDQEALLFQIPRGKENPSARVSQVFPSADKLPENLLKFYVHFSEPMNRGAAYQHIQLLRGADVLDSPFLELGEELWDAEQRRFTLFIHPGRIKRGLKPRQDEGPPLSSGNEYTLRILSTWTDASGLPMVESYDKKFTVTVADHRQPELEAWKIETPDKETTQPVRLIMNEPMDHGMLGRVLTVKHQSGDVISGKIQIAQQETEWEFVPDEAWQAGTYLIEIAANLEDLSGNSIARPFEVKMQERTAAEPSVKVAIEFVVK
ncbi:MAG: Ig-like domain-containing protein [bacterium]|nr:Ig-like domain-containing protein [bacterium]